MMRSSVIIPTSNRPTRLMRAVLSALAALPDDSEILVIDDASERPATDILAHLGDRPLRIIRNESQLGGGGSPSRNIGARAALGKVLFFLDDDDEVKPDYFKAILRVTDNPELKTDFGFCARRFVTDVPAASPVYKDERQRLPEGVISHDAGFSDKTFPFSAGFWITRDAYESVGPFSEDLKTNSDTDYCVRLYASQYTGWHAATPGVLIYQSAVKKNGEQASVTKRTKSAERAAAFRRIAERNASALQQDPQAAYFVYSRYIKHLMRAGEGQQARDAINLPTNSAIRRKLLFQYAKLKLFSKRA